MCVNYLLVLVLLITSSATSFFLGMKYYLNHKVEIEFNHEEFKEFIKGLDACDHDAITWRFGVPTLFQPLKCVKCQKVLEAYYIAVKD